MTESSGAGPLSLSEAVSRACPEIAPSTIHEFLERLGEAYAGRRSPEEIALHVRLAAEVGPERPARVHVSPGPRAATTSPIVAVDYFGEFSILCGLLAVHGLSIESGEVHTFRPVRTSARSPRRAAPLAALDQDRRRLPGGSSGRPRRPRRGEDGG